MQFLNLSGAFLTFLTSPVSTQALIISELVLSGIFVLLVFLFKPRLLKIICACAAEFMLWFACDQYFPNTILSEIMTWITAFVAIVVVITLVNHIDWSNLRGKKN